MPRPSRHLDRALLAAGRELLPAHGCAGPHVRAGRRGRRREHRHVPLPLPHARGVPARGDAAGLRGDVLAAHRRHRDARRARARPCAPRCASSGASCTTTARSSRGSSPMRSRRRARRARFPARQPPAPPARAARADRRGPDGGRASTPMAPTQAFAFCAGALAMPILWAGARATAAPSTLPSRATCARPSSPNRRSTSASTSPWRRLPPRGARHDRQGESR